MIDVMKELRPIGEQFVAGEYLRGLQSLESLWMSIPDPKPATLNSYMIVEYAVTFSLKMGNLIEAKNWASMAPLFIEDRHDDGEVEFLVGKVAFECGELSSARDSFLVAKKKSKGRLLRGTDERYIALIK